MYIEKTCEQLKKMNLSQMALSLRNRIENGDHIDLSHEQFVSLIVEDEFVTRQDRRLQRMIRRAEFKPELPSVEDIIYTSGRGITKQDMMQFTSVQWIKNAHNIILTGPTGSGKSFIAQAIGFQACKMSFPSLNIRYNILIEQIEAAKATGMYLKYLKKMNKIKVLIIDDFVMADISNACLTALMDIIEDKQQTGAVIITTQYPISTWHKKMPDPTIADAICDRLVNTAYKFNLKGEESMRKFKKNPK